MFKSTERAKRDSRSGSRRSYAKACKVWNQVLCRLKEAQRMRKEESKKKILHLWEQWADNPDEATYTKMH